MDHMLRNPNKAFLAAIESDLVHYHKERMVKRQAMDRSEIRAEERKASPDAARVRKLREDIAFTTRNMFNTAVTVQEVVNPMRKALGLPPRVVEERDTAPRRAMAPAR